MTTTSAAEHLATIIENASAGADAWRWGFTCSCGEGVFPLSSQEHAQRAADHHRLRTLVDELTSALNLWSTNDDSKAQPGVRQAATTAVHTIDALTRRLHEIRQRVVSEAFRSDRAADARVDAMFAHRRGEA